VDFSADYEEIELQKISYDVILVTSCPKTSQTFSFFPQSKFFATPVVDMLPF